MTRYACAAMLALLMVGCGKTSTTSGTNSPSGERLPDVPVEGFKKLGIEDIEPGKGYAAQKGDIVVVDYSGHLVNGTVFDENMDPKTLKGKIDKDPYPVTIGTGGVIKGWDEGLVGTKEGTVRKLNIPYAMAYGTDGSGEKIPPKADLIFTVKILKVYKQGQQPEIEANDVKKGTGPKVTANSTVTFKYKGQTLHERIFDEQEKITSPVSKLIPGFKDVIIGMQAGGQRRIAWPPGSPNPTGQIPGNQPVEYIVDVIAVK